MISVYPNLYGLPVIKLNDDYEDGLRGIEPFEVEPEESVDLFKAADDEYVKETLQKMQ